MRHARFFDWLDEATDGPVLGTIKTIVAALMLLSFVVLGVRAVVDYRADMRRANEHAVWPVGK